MPACAVRRVVREHDGEGALSLLSELAVRKEHDGAEHLMLHWLPAINRLLSVRLERVDAGAPAEHAKADGPSAAELYNGRNWFPVRGLPLDPTPAEVRQVELSESEPEPERLRGPSAVRSSWRSMEYTAPLSKLSEAAAAVGAVQRCAAITRLEVKRPSISRDLL